MTGDELGNGAAYFAINGDIIAHASVTGDVPGSEPSLVLTPSTAVDYPAELLAELIHPDVIDALTRGIVTEEFKCSRFGRGVLKAAKYAMYGAATAVTAACCGSVTPACLACAFGAGAGAAGVGDVFDDYCE